MAHPAGDGLGHTRLLLLLRGRRGGPEAVLRALRVLRRRCCRGCRGCGVGVMSSLAPGLGDEAAAAAGAAGLPRQKRERCGELRRGGH